ncbi:Uu.00g128210.m01.CDS01 [Anthostomella pinea]|uniref:Uu.00g128210.m01.CDS01 n=1 Tax=Anthostomella pinea TaxID=933095 RepID=A0AAI8VIB2_9PEZI|nr:Uu.00g128210.m01.CDS01 [Anthostomella pinea]
MNYFFTRLGGPFKSVDDFNRSFLPDKAGGDEAIPGMNNLCRCFCQVARTHSTPVFMHPDLAQRNVMVRPDGSVCIIDWEVSGWYPLYWEYLKGKDLHKTLPFLEEFEEEFNLMAKIRMLKLQAVIEGMRRSGKV